MSIMFLMHEYEFKSETKKVIVHRAFENIKAYNVWDLWHLNIFFYLLK